MFNVAADLKTYLAAKLIEVAEGRVKLEDLLSGYDFDLTELNDIVYGRHKRLGS